MGGYCSKALDEQCGHHGCGFSCQCHSCDEKPVCDCSCRWLVVGGLALLVLSGWIMHLAYKEQRRWLLSWAAVYFVMAAVMTLVTYARGPDPHDAFGCSLPFSLWAGALFVASMTYYTSDYMRADHGTLDRDKHENWVYDPTVGQYVLSQHNQLHQHHAK